MRQSLHEYDDRSEDYGLVGEERAGDAMLPRRDRRLPAVLVSVAAMVLFAGGLWFAYVEGTRHATTGNTAAAQSDGVPLLRADTRPSKVKPDQPGGMAVPDQNVSLYGDKPGGSPVEKLLPAPEQPMPRPAPSTAPAAVAPPNAGAPAGGATGAPAIVPTAVPTGPVTAKPLAKPAAKAPVETRQASGDVAPSRPTRNSAVQVRLGSLKSPEAAREEWAKLKRNNSDLLGKMTANAVRVDLGDKGIYYRIEAGPFHDKAAAERLCSDMKARKLGCILAR
ncbi:MAG TPA: SPOR domain-containing protein [Stellaceae bacterium]|jgi:hypothetical protein|nr:SPOR domain-containing protein [Stellaceae bacterium]